MKINKSKKGFTLLEIILVIGLIAIVTIGIYVTYIKKFKSAEGAVQSQLLLVLNSKMIGAFKNTMDATQNAQDSTRISGQVNAFVTNTAGLISLGIIPSELVRGATINTTWGTPIVFTSGVYSDTTSTPPRKMIFYTETFIVDEKQVCSAILSNESLMKDSLSVTVNGLPVKNAGSQTLNIANIAAGCSNPNARIAISFPIFDSNYDYRGNLDCTDCGMARNKEGRYNINSGVAGATTDPSYGSDPCNNSPSIDNAHRAKYDINSGVCVCTNGTAANPQQWIGNKCVDLWTKSSPNNNGFCPLGYGWVRNAGDINNPNDFSKRCKLLPNDKPASARDFNKQIGLDNCANLDPGSEKNLKEEDIKKYSKEYATSRIDCASTLHRVNFRTWKTEKETLSTKLSNVSKDCVGCGDPLNGSTFLNKIKSSSLNSNGDTKIGDIAYDDKNFSDEYNKGAGRLIPKNVGFYVGDADPKTVINPKNNFSYVINSNVKNIGPYVDNNGIAVIRPNNTIPARQINSSNQPVDNFGFNGTQFNTCVQNGGKWEVDRCVTADISKSYVSNKTPPQRSTLDENTNILKIADNPTTINALKQCRDRGGFFRLDESNPNSPQYLCTIP